MYTDPTGHDTFAIFTSVQGAFGVSGAYSYAYGIDSHGNIAKLKSVAFGGGTPSIGFGGGIQITSANSLNDLTDLGAQWGGSVFIVTGEYTGSKSYNGANVSVGKSWSVIPLEVHAQVTYTWMKGLSDKEKKTLISMINARKYILNKKLSIEMKEGINKALGQEIFKVTKKKGDYNIPKTKSA